MNKNLSHVDENGMPAMVDVMEKSVTFRAATARSLVRLPAALKEFLRGDEILVKKGPVFQTAVIAGTMAVKKTHELIPFCHQIPVEGCKFKIGVSQDLFVTIECEVRTTGKTGVELEALHGASVAALTVYDMCKAISHEIVIEETKLLSKVGGKHTFLGSPLYGLVLTGGKSERMKKDKALLSYGSGPHARRLYDILKKYCTDVYLSARDGQWHGSPLADLPTIPDLVENQGPMGGIISAFARHRDANWFVVACDLPYFNEAAAEKLLFNFDAAKAATCFKNSEKGFPEALCAIYSPIARDLFEKAFSGGLNCPVKVLKNAACKTIEQGDSVNMANANTPEEFEEARLEIR
jgi:cyclic pyranopterin phosphate synthase